MGEPFRCVKVSDVTSPRSVRSPVSSLMRRKPVGRPAVEAARTPAIEE